MQIQAINNNNQTFGATLKVHNCYAKSKMKSPIIDFLEKEFPKRTKDIEGHLDLDVGYLSETESFFSTLKFALFLL